MPDVPEGFREREKTSFSSSPPFPAVSWNRDTGNINILENARKTIGDPEHVRVYYKDTSIAIVPSHPDADNSYTVTNSTLSSSWLENELDMEIPSGRYRAQDANGMLVVDFAEGPIDG